MFFALFRTIFLHFLDKCVGFCYTVFVGGKKMNDNFIITEIHRVAMVDRDEYPEKKTKFSANLKYNELIFHYSGRTTVYFDDLALETSPNTIRFLPKGEVKKYEVERQESGECIFVAFSTDKEISGKAFVIDAEKNEKLGTLFKKLFSAWIGKSQGYYFETISILYKIFAEMQSNNFVPKQHYLKIKPAVDLLQDKFLSDEITVAKLAEICGIGESYFLRLFKEKFGMPPKRYIVQLRINHASELLRHGEYSVTQVAEMAGFSDIYFFSRQFKAYTGLTPSEFIKKYKSSK